MINKGVIVTKNFVPPGRNRDDQLRSGDKCEHELKDICFYLKTEKYVRGGKIALYS